MIAYKFIGNYNIYIYIYYNIYIMLNTCTHKISCDIIIL